MGASKCVYPLPKLTDGRRGLVTSRAGKAALGPNDSRPDHLGDDWLYLRRDYDYKTEAASHGHKKYVVPPGTACCAIARGQVRVSGKIASGYRIWLRLDDDYWVGYFHLKHNLLVKGAEVFPGTLLGYIGDNPRDKGDPAHLHFEVRNPEGKNIDPWKYLKGRGATHFNPLENA